MVSAPASGSTARRGAGRYLAATAVVVLVYLAGARLGLQLAFANRNVTTVWPPTGVAVAALVLLGLRFWPAVSVGAMLANLMNGAAPDTAAMISIGNTVAPLVAALLLSRVLKMRTELDRVRDVVVLMLVGGLLSMAVSATLGVAALVLGGALASAQYGQTWLTWWIGDSMGVILLAPLLLVGAALRRPPRITGGRLAEATTVVLALVAASGVPFFTHLPLTFLIFPPVLWAAVRWGRLGGAFAVLLTSSISIAATVHGGGPYTGTLSVTGELILLQSFNGCVAVGAMVLATVTEQAGRSRRALLRLTAELETEVEARTAELLASNRAKTEYLSRISHELRTPLTAIIGYSDLLAMEESTGRKLEQLSAVTRASEHLLALVNDVLDINSIEARTQRTPLEPLQVGPAMEEGAGLVAGMAEEQRIQVRTTPPAETTAWVQANAAAVRQVLVNLVSNAIKYTPAGGAVTLTAAATSSGRIRITVADTGPGIAPELLSRLFVPFDRLGAERTTIPGTGLGLALCRQLVDSMGGVIGVESQVGRGSSFWLELDQVSPPEGWTAAAEAAPADGATATDPLTILCIEDDAATAELMERIFRRRPTVRAVFTARGDTALDLALRETPGAVLLDLHLPDVSGEEVLAELMRDPSTAGIPVIVISADAASEVIARLLRAGAHRYLTKPLRVRTLLRLLDELASSTSRPASAAWAESTVRR